jgi:uncharacterized OB-fold protein
MIVETKFGALEPTIDRDSKPFWDALAEDKLRLPWCRACERFFFPPVARCLRCGAVEVGLKEASREAVVYSWVDVHRSLHPAFDDDVPYTIVVADLACGVRMVGRLLDASPAGLRAGMLLRFCGYRARGFVLPGFQAATDDAQSHHQRN